MINAVEVIKDEGCTKMKSKRKKGKKIAIYIVLSIVMVLVITMTTLCFIYIDDTDVDYDDYVVSSDNTNGKALKIIHLSDLHFPKIKVDVDEMLHVIEDNEVDFIAITGDIIDSNADVLNCGVLGFIDRLVKLSPVYYVTGNHEANHPQRQFLYDSMDDSGVIILEDESVYFDIEDKQITIMGVSDNSMWHPDILGDNNNIDNYKILLAHRPERERSVSYFDSNNDEYLASQPELVLAGHAHGGQFRIGEQGMVAPNQGIFPEYDSGIYKLSDKTSMIVSRGIGNSIIPFRFNNKPHVPIITIYL